MKYRISRKRIRMRHTLAARWRNVPGWPDDFCLTLYPVKR